MMDTLRSLWQSPLFRQGVGLVIGLLVVFLGARALRHAAGRYIQNADTRYRSRKAISGISYGVAVVVILVVFSGRMGGLTVAVGAASAGVAFALQEVIASFAGWVALSFGGFYTVGDRVQLGGIVGDVIDIGVLRTTLMECGAWVKGDLYNGRIVRVANSFVFKEPVFNYSGDFPYLWDEITVPVKFGSDYARARAMLEGIVAEVAGPHLKDAKARWDNTVRTYRVEDARIDPLVTVVVNDNWVEYTVRYVTPFRARRVTKDALFERLLQQVDASEGKVMLASATFHLVEAPTFNVRLEGDKAA
ncbi:MAG TPA: mechanosensitive ion channel [Polyangiaceae bacterium]|nr:mechanosensitive ion channel [Polyangiaceae bacterium]